MKFDTKDLSSADLLAFYRALLLPRLIEEKMLILLRQGKISKWFSGYGQEAISVGATLAMQSDEYILPMHRNLGIFTTREVPLDRLFAQFQGKSSGFTKGRDRSFHFGSQAHHLVGMISHLGPQMGVADGIALAHKLRNQQKATLVITGDGGASEGDFHEAVNLAAVWQLPVIFLIENNCWGLSTPSHEQFNFDSFTLKGPGYGIQTRQVDGNNLLEVYHTIEEAAKTARHQSQPILVECMTFRIRGHEEASGTKYYPKGLIDKWTSKDPIDNYESFLLGQGLMTAKQVEEIKTELNDKITLALQQSNAEAPVTADTKVEEQDLYAPYKQKITLPKSRRKNTLRFVDALSEGLEQALERHPELVLMGQDIAEYGGVFKVTEGFAERFGKERIRNTPISESAVIGSALGLSIQGMKAIVEMQFADFVTCGFNQIVNNLAKSHYRWDQPADVVIRMPTGAGVGAGPFHSQSNESWFFHTPGLKIVYPSTPYDAKGLLHAAIEDPNPYLYFEHKALYRSQTQNVPQDYYTVEVGKARYVTRGEDLTVITYGMGVHWAIDTLTELETIDAEIVDLRTLLPWDQETVRISVNKTNKVLILHEDTLTGGIGAEIAAWISEHCFESLDAPVMREASLDTPVPFAKPLEDNYLPKLRLKQKLLDLHRY
ncbi:dehydrogenase [Reichenbachiella sp. 5M10]|uniref:alpha-ketoacid dehydrogenase subunit alpha/beta n=1 Tax=Reichenbachiella sp. 5M10 TaxID=1889772 RepID=UPI000C15BD01|nr:dehydrogenase E1 component subunit alpha/beta [Reichenbachiella sp. 5M10]PIB34070.1 dehydrogenase [Reichenbachiella sp. 5M10]